MNHGSLGRLAARVPLRVQTLGPGAWLVQRRSGPRLRTRVVGGAEARTRLVYDRRASRAHMRAVQRGLGTWLLQEQLAWLFRELGVTVVLDVGANAGQYATGLRRAGYRGRIVSFEPVAEFADRLRAAAADDPDWQVHRYALGEEEGTARIHATPGRALSSLLPATEFGRSWHTALREPVPEEVAVRRLDAVLDEVTAGVADPRVYLKLDTQGFDLAVVRGAGERLADVLALQTEAAWLPLYEGMPLLEEHLGELRAAGFDVAGVFPVGRHARTLRVIEFDVLMVRPEAFAR